jgi:hypothetical protein
MFRNYAGYALKALFPEQIRAPARVILLGSRYIVKQGRRRYQFRIQRDTRPRKGGSYAAGGIRNSRTVAYYMFGRTVGFEHRQAFFLCGNAIRRHGHH